MSASNSASQSAGALSHRISALCPLTEFGDEVVPAGALGDFDQLGEDGLVIERQRWGLRGIQRTLGGGMAVG